MSPLGLLPLNLSPTPLFAFGFGNAMMLGWLAAAAVPILIHLWNRRKHREVAWAAMEYLLAAVRKNSRRIRVEQWLLLATRTAIVLCVVLAMAEPFVGATPFGFSSGSRSLKAIVIDGSYSMAYKPADTTRFEQAKQLARRIVEDSPQGDRFVLLLLASPPQVIVAQPAYATLDLYAEIDNLKMPDGGGDVAATLDKLQEVLRAAGADVTQQQAVYFITDLGRTSWGVENRGERFASQIDELAKSASLHLLDVGQGSTENLAVTELRLDNPYATTIGESAFVTTIQNFGAQPTLQQLLELFIDGNRVAETKVDCRAGESTVARLSHRFNAAGMHAVEARLNPDLLALDNHRWLALPVKSNLRVLCVDGKPAGEGLPSAAEFVAIALDPDPTVDSSVQVKVVGEGGLLDEDLTTFDAVFCCNVGQFTSSEARLLHAYVQGGGGLILFLGDRVDADRYNRELATTPESRLLPATLGAIKPEGTYRFDPLNYRHPLVAPFKGREQAGLLTTPVYRYFELKPAPGKAVVALAFNGGDPAIIEEQIGHGRVILVATDGSLSSIDPTTKTPWSTMAAWPSFLPIVQELLALAANARLSAFNVDVGEAIGAAASSATTSLTLVAPDGRQESVRSISDSQGSHWTATNTLQAGLYRLEATTAGATASENSAVFAVNLNTRESDLTRIDPTELPPAIEVSTSTASGDATSVRLAAQTEMNQLLLYCALALLLFEVFLAWRVGHAHA